MTTIAYKDGKLAADTQLTYSGGVRGTTRKIEIFPDGRVVAIAGDVSQEYWLRQELMGVKVPKEKRKYKGVEAIVIDGDKVYQCFDGPELIELHDKSNAIGHGGHFAKAAMGIGMTAKEAVKFAGGIDIYTNKIVDVYDTKLQKITYGK